MPGRKSTGPPLPLQRPSSSQIRKPQGKKSKTRGLNAFAIAEQENPQNFKIRRSRLGQEESGDNISSKRKRGGGSGDSDDDDDDHDDDEDDSGRSGKRRNDGDGDGNDARPRQRRRREPLKDRYGEDVEQGSDSEGNEWTLGHVASGDDSELDSDEAMGESDEERFEGFAFRGSKSSKDNNKRRKMKGSSGKIGAGQGSVREIDLNEDEDEDQERDGDTGSESDDFRENAVDLADMLDERSNEDDLDDNDDSDDDGTDDSGVDSGSDVTDRSDDQESALSMSDAEDDSNNLAKLASLRKLVSSMEAADMDTTSSRRRQPDVQEMTTPSDYGLNPTRKLTAADLLPTVTNPELRKSLKILMQDDNKPRTKSNGIPQKLEAPLPKRQQDRLERTAAYEKSKETLNRWIDTVKQNRRAEHLVFPLPNPEAEGNKQPPRLSAITQTAHANELEAKIQSILIESGLADPDGKSSDAQIQEFEELATNKLPIEEVQARRAELRQARALLFREEIRAKRIKKIKSKSYRRVHRRERERNAQKEKDALEAAGVEPDEEEQERIDRQRAVERMGQRHRESRWAKSVKGSGRAAWNEDARMGFTDMARRGDELRRRIEGKDVRNDEDDESLGDDESEEGDDNEEGDDVDDDEETRDAKLRNTIQRLESGNPFVGGSSGTGERLASMKFMQKAEENRRKQNYADVKLMKKDLLDGERTSDSEDEDGVEGAGRRSYGPKRDQKPRNTTASNTSRNELEERESSGDEATMSKSRPNDENEINLGQSKSQASKRHQGQQSSLSNRADAKRRSKVDQHETFAEGENPWLIMPSKKSNNKDSRKARLADDPVLISNDPDVISFSASNNPKSPPTGTAKEELSTATRTAKQSSSQKTSSKPILLDDASFSGFSDSDSDSNNDERSNPKLTTAAATATTEKSTLESARERNLALIAQAFASDNVLAEKTFAAEKATEISSSLPNPSNTNTTLPGWGSWIGSGISARAAKRNAYRMPSSKKDGNRNGSNSIPATKRVDYGLDKVIVSEKRSKKNGKYLAGELPHPFESRQQYERSLRVPLGGEWLTKVGVQEGTKPRVILKRGVVVGVMERPAV
ncbi:hypothetical protein MMC25_006753 [Agyrium rufum]|nr:hypothetical protein [Agyrium rufum]